MIIEELNRPKLLKHLSLIFSVTDVVQFKNLWGCHFMQLRFLNQIDFILLNFVWISLKFFLKLIVFLFWIISWIEKDLFRDLICLLIFYFDKLVSIEIVFPSLALPNVNIWAFKSFEKQFIILVEVQWRVLKKYWMLLLIIINYIAFIIINCITSQIFTF